MKMKIYGSSVHVPRRVKHSTIYIFESRMKTHVQQFICDLVQLPFSLHTQKGFGSMSFISKRPSGERQIFIKITTEMIQSTWQRLGKSNG